MKSTLYIEMLVLFYLISRFSIRENQYIHYTHVYIYVYYLFYHTAPDVVNFGKSHYICALYVRKFNVFTHAILSMLHLTITTHFIIISTPVKWFIVEKQKTIYSTMILSQNINIKSKNVQHFKKINKCRFFRDIFG